MAGIQWRVTKIKLIRPGETRDELVHQILAQSYQPGVCLQMCRDCSIHQRSGTIRNSVERDQKLIKLGKANDEFDCQILAPSDL